MSSATAKKAMGEALETVVADVKDDPRPKAKAKGSAKAKAKARVIDPKEQEAKKLQKDIKAFLV